MKHTMSRADVELRAHGGPRGYEEVRR